MENIISSLVTNKSQNSLYVSDTENSNHFKETISFTCYNKKKNIEKIHTFTLEEWNNYLQTVDSIHNLKCLKCDRIIEKNEYIKNGTFIHKNGEKIIECTNYVNGVLHGLYERFYLNGIHYERTHYKNGICHGPCEFWYDITGKKMKDMHFENGKLHGAYKYWDQNGKLVEDFYFNHGIRTDILIKIPSKNPIDLSNIGLNIDSSKVDNIQIQEEEKNNNTENMDSMFDLSKKKKKDKKEKKEKKERKERKEMKNDSESDSDLEMEKI